MRRTISCNASAGSSCSHAQPTRWPQCCDARHSFEVGTYLELQFDPCSPWIEAQVKEAHGEHCYALTLFVEFSREGEVAADLEQRQMMHRQRLMHRQQQ